MDHFDSDFTERETRSAGALWEQLNRQAELQWLNALIERTPRADLLHRRGHLLWKLDRRRDAMADYRAALQLTAFQEADTVEVDPR